MKSWIRIDFDEDQELLRAVTLGPAIKEYVESLSDLDLSDFLLDLCDYVWKIWYRNDLFNKELEGDEK